MRGKGRGTNRFEGQKLQLKNKTQSLKKQIGVKEREEITGSKLLEKQ